MNFKNIRTYSCKALANLISTFLQTACNPSFQQSLFHSWLYRYYVEDHTNLPNPGYPPYYSQSFFNIIKKVKDKTPLNPIRMSVKQWYTYLLESKVTMREIDQEGRTEIIPCKVEQRDPAVLWGESYRLSRLRGLSPESKSFLFRMIHTLLPSRERVHHLTQTSSPLCWCESGADEDFQDLFFECVKNREAGEAVIRCVKSYVVLLATGLQYIWKNR